MKRCVDENAVVEVMQKRCRETIEPIAVGIKRPSASPDESIHKRPRSTQEECVKVEDAVVAVDRFEEGRAIGRTEATDEILASLSPIVEEITRDAVRELNEKYDEMFTDLCRSLGFTSERITYLC